MKNNKLKRLKELLIDAKNHLEENGAGLKSYEIEFQNCIEKVFPDYCWWEVLNHFDIFGALFFGRLTPDEVIMEIIANVQPEYLKEGCKGKKAVKETKKLEEGTSNFRSLDHLPLLVFFTDDEVYDMMDYDLGDIEDDDERYKKEQEYFDNFKWCILYEEDLEKLIDDIRDFNYDTTQIAYDLQDEEETAQEGYTLEDIEVELKPGYYQGAQIDVKWEKSLQDISEAQRKRFVDFFKEIKNKYGLSELGVSYRFSNGETGYYRIEENLNEFYEPLDSFKTFEYAKKTNQGWDIVKAYKDLEDNRVHVIAYRPKRGDYAVGIGYTPDGGHWNQGWYDFSTMDDAEKALLSDYSVVEFSLDTYKPELKEEATSEEKCESSRFFVYDDNGEIVSDGFEYYEDARDFAVERGHNTVKQHYYYRETPDSTLKPLGEPKVVTGEDTERIKEDTLSKEEACTSEGCKEDKLPKVVEFNASEVDLDADDEDASEILSDLLSDTYGYCHFGFDYDIIRNENGEPSKYICKNIKWDTNESLSKDKKDKLKESAELSNSPYRKLIGEYFNFSADFDFLDIVASILDRVENFEDDEDINQAINDELIFTAEQWTVIMHYCTPRDANFYDAIDDLTSDIYSLCSKIAGGEHIEEKLEEETTKELSPQYDSRKSFYGKARVRTLDDGTEILYSYNTPVVRVKDGQVTLLSRGYLGWASSPTTLRHVKEFLQQRGFKTGSVRDIAKLYPQEQAHLFETSEAENVQGSKLKQRRPSSRRVTIREKAEKKVVKRQTRETLGKFEEPRRK